MAAALSTAATGTRQILSVKSIWALAGRVLLFRTGWLGGPGGFLFARVPTLLALFIAGVKIAREFSGATRPTKL